MPMWDTTSMMRRGDRLKIDHDNCDTELDVVNRRPIRLAWQSYYPAWFTFQPELEA